MPTRGRPSEFGSFKNAAIFGGAILAAIGAG